MLIAISGSQGSGKSTVLTELKKHGYNIIERKTSRSVLSDWGVSLQEVNNKHELTIAFQEEISKRKVADEEQAIASDDVWFTERSHADFFTYALVSLGKDNDYSDWLDTYYTSCMSYNQHYADVFYLRAGQFDVVSDGTRGANMHYSRMVDLTMLDFTKKMCPNPDRIVEIKTGNLSRRVDMITQGLRQV